MWLLPRRESSYLKHKSGKRTYFGSVFNRTLTPFRGGQFDEQYRARGHVTRYFQVIVGRIRNVSASITGLFRVPPSRNVWNNRHVCARGQSKCSPRSQFASASCVHDGNNFAGSGVPGSKNGSNTRLD